MTVENKNKELHEAKLQERRIKNNLKYISINGLQKDIVGNLIYPGDICVVKDYNKISIGLCSHYTHSCVIFRMETLEGLTIEGMENKSMFSCWRNVYYHYTDMQVLNISRMKEYKTIKLNNNERAN